MSAGKLNSIICDPIKRTALEKRFWSKIDRRGPDECWTWIAKAKHKHGYGMLMVCTGLVDYSHRISFALSNGGVEDGAHVRHSCDNPPCCNPRHLLAGTPADNTRDMLERGRNYTGEMTADRRRRTGETRKANFRLGKIKPSERQKQAARNELKARWSDPEWRKRWSETMSGENSPGYGRRFNHTEEARRKISEAQIGRKHSSETKEKMRAAALEREARRRSLQE